MEANSSIANIIERARVITQLILKYQGDYKLYMDENPATQPATPTPRNSGNPFDMDAKFQAHEEDAKFEAHEEDAKFEASEEDEEQTPLEEVEQPDEEEEVAPYYEYEQHQQSTANTAVPQRASYHEEDFTGRSVIAGNNPLAPKVAVENPATRRSSVTEQNPQDDVKMSSGDEAEQPDEFQAVSDDDEVQARSITPKAPVSNEAKTQPASPVSGQQLPPSSPLTDRSHYSLPSEDELRISKPVSHIISGRRDMSAVWDKTNNPTPPNKPYLHNTYADKISGQRNASTSRDDANKPKPRKKSAYLHNTYDKDDSGV